MGYNKANKKTLLEKLEKILRDVVFNYVKENNLTDIKLYDIKLIRGKEIKLQVFLDGKNVNLDVCADINNIFSELLDADDIVTYNNYTLEVSSAGIDRKLKSISEARSFIGKFCLIVLSEPLDGDISKRKRFLGTLKKITDDEVMIFVKKERQEFTIDQSKINYIKLEIEV